MKKTTIYDYARMCASFDTCNQCVLLKFCAEQRNIFSNDIDKANEIILKWCEEHPAETRQNRFLEQYPNVRMDNRMVISICPQKIDSTFESARCDTVFSCEECRKQYWLAEVEK